MRRRTVFFVLAGRPPAWGLPWSHVRKWATAESREQRVARLITLVLAETLRLQLYVVVRGGIESRREPGGTRPRRTTFTGETRPRTSGTRWAPAKYWDRPTLSLAVTGAPYAACGMTSSGANRAPVCQPAKGIAAILRAPGRRAKAGRIPWATRWSYEGFRAPRAPANNAAALKTWFKGRV